MGLYALMDDAAIEGKGRFHDILEVEMSKLPMGKKYSIIMGNFNERIRKKENGNCVEEANH